MSAIVTLILQFLPYLVTASQSVPEIIGFIAGLREIFSRTESWTPEQEAAFDAETAAMRESPYWKVAD